MKFILLMGPRREVSGGVRIVERVKWENSGCLEIRSHGRTSYDMLKDYPGCTDNSAVPMRDNNLIKIFELDTRSSQNGSYDSIIALKIYLQLQLLWEEIFHDKRFSDIIISLLRHLTEYSNMNSNKYIGKARKLISYTSIKFLYRSLLCTGPYTYFDYFKILFPVSQINIIHTLPKLRVGAVDSETTHGLTTSYLLFPH
jgi:hypothetical protein